MAAETFRKDDVTKLLTNKFVVIIGDSVHRSVYKDFVVFLQDDRLLSHRELKNRGENAFCRDRLYEGGKLHNGSHYREVRQFCPEDGNHMVRYYFVTKAYNDYWETIFEDFRRGPEPDVIIMNSCLWDMNKYGSSWLHRYQDNLDRMLSRLRHAIPEDCLVIWNTCMPVGRKARGGFMAPGMQSWRSDILRYDVLEANFYAKQAVENHGFDILDLNFNFRQIHGYHLYRMPDDVHWDQRAHRMITNLLLSHISDAWGVTKPKYMKPLNGDLKPRGQRRHARSHTIDARSVNQVDQNNNYQHSRNDREYRPSPWSLEESRHMKRVREDEDERKVRAREVWSSTRHVDVVHRGNPEVTNEPMSRRICQVSEIPLPLSPMPTKRLRVEDSHQMRPPPPNTVSSGRQVQIVQQNPNMAMQGFQPCFQPMVVTPMSQQMLGMNCMPNFCPVKFQPVQMAQFYPGNNFLMQQNFRLMNPGFSAHITSMSQDDDNKR